MRRRRRWFCAVLLCVGGSSPAGAQTDEIQVYDAEIVATGAVALDLHNNYTPSGRRRPAFPGGLLPDHTLNGVAEWAYGVTPWFEAGLYLPLYSVTRDHSVLYDGFKLRALLVSPDAASRTVFYGVNFEFSFNTGHWDPRRYTSEIRPIIGAHLGRVDLIFNPIVDNSYVGVSRLEFVPATRVAVRVGQDTKLALEEYDDFGRVSHFLPSGQQTHQLFAVVDHPVAGFDIELGVGAGLNAATDHRVVKLIVMREIKAADPR